MNQKLAQAVSPFLDRYTRSHRNSKKSYGQSYKQLASIKQAAWVGTITSVLFALVTEGLAHQVFALSLLLALGALAFTNFLETRL